MQDLSLFIFNFRIKLASIEFFQLTLTDYLDPLAYFELV
jgi:hypothetical protein